MTHPRLTASNGRVAARRLKGVVEAESFVDGEMCQVVNEIADVCRSPEGGVDCQLLFGSGFVVLENDQTNGWSFGYSVGDGYVGYVKSSALGQEIPTTHKVSALASHRYGVPDMKTRPVGRVSFGSCVSVVRQTEEFTELADGTFMPTPHLTPVGEYEADYVSVLQRFLGIPYLWGGNSVWGMDCSGAVQLALGSAGISALRDSDMQESSLGRELAPDEALQRGDFIFWKGHIATMIDSEQIVHAAAFAMSVVVEPLGPAIERIEKSGGGPVTCRRRL